MTLRMGMRGAGTCAAIASVTAAGGLAVAAAASAQDADTEVIEAVGTSWDRTEVTIDVGDTVEWQFDQGGEMPHNVASDSDNWSYATPIEVQGPPQDHTFTEPGTYRFICQVHPIQMQ
ncbi:MAG TPA: plastocyanin/azurin family copper-binding protein, partial [Solirubrobacteraceae bacterium]|nr:plastocyanin/azurin family copper-binding protein [Solirubrobacteraceae bacterium]